MADEVEAQSLSLEERPRIRAEVRYALIAALMGSSLRTTGAKDLDLCIMLTPQQYAQQVIGKLAPATREPLIMTVKFSGKIVCDDADTVLALFQAWLERSDLSVRDKMSGEQISVAGPPLSVECFRSFGADGYGDSFLLEGTIADQAGDARALLERLQQVCAARAIRIRPDSSALA